MADRLTERLRPHVDEIEADAYAGCVRARQILRLHRFWFECPRDPAAPALCEAALDDWLRHRKADVPKEPTS